MYTPRSDPHMHDFKVTRNDPPKWPAPAPARPPQKWFSLSNKKWPAIERVSPRVTFQQLDLFEMDIVDMYRRVGLTCIAE